LNRARDIPVFREVAGEYAFYFSGNKLEDLADAVKAWFGLVWLGANNRDSYRLICIPRHFAFL